MGELSKWVEQVHAFIEEIARLTTEAGADGQVLVRDLERALAAVDPSGRLRVADRAEDAERAAVESQEEFLQHGISIGDAPGSRELIPSLAPNAKMEAALAENEPSKRNMQLDNLDNANKNLDDYGKAIGEGARMRPKKDLV